MMRNTYQFTLSHYQWNTIDDATSYLFASDNFQVIDYIIDESPLNCVSSKFCCPTNLFCLMQKFVRINELIMNLKLMEEVENVLSYKISRFRDIEVKNFSSS
jgi:hypothetical protein